MASLTSLVRPYRRCASKGVGCILQISSVGGRLTRPGSTPYHAAKWAVGGFTESHAQELSPFGVKVCALEPGGMRTNWGDRANQDTPELLPETVRLEALGSDDLHALRPRHGAREHDFDVDR